MSPRSIDRTLFLAAMALLVPGPTLSAASPVSAAPPHVTRFAIPTPNSQPIEITLGPDGNMWFTESNSGKVAKVTPAGGITEFRTPTPSFPYDITAGPGGNVWFTEGATGKLVVITPSGHIREVTFPLFDAAGGIATGPDGNIW